MRRQVRRPRKANDAGIRYELMNAGRYKVLEGSRGKPAIDGATVVDAGESTLLSGDSAEDSVAVEPADQCRNDSGRQ